MKERTVEYEYEGTALVGIAVVPDGGGPRFDSLSGARVSHHRRAAVIRDRLVGRAVDLQRGCRR